MKIINEKGKLFGIINVVDLIVVLVVVAVLAGIVWKVGVNKLSDAIASDMEITFTVKIDAVDEDLLKEIQKTLPSSIMNNGEYVDGQVVGAEFLNYVTEGEDSSGNVVTFPENTMCSAMFTCTAQVPEGSVNLPVGSQEIRLGKTVIIKTRYFELSGTVMSLDIPK